MNETCPFCKADLTGDPIPQEYIDKGFYASGVTNYSRKIGVEIPEAYDGVLFWECPDCQGRWHRFSKGDRLFNVADNMIDAWNLRKRRG